MEILTPTGSLRQAARGLLVLALTVAMQPAAAAARFTITPEAPDLVGELHLTTTVSADTLSDLARAYHQGYYEMRLANPGVDPWLPGDGAEVVVPNLYVLPAAPRQGIVVNVPEMRMYYYPGPARGKGGRDTASSGEVMTFPISIGRQNWVTPHGNMKIVAKAKDPAWYPPESIREEHAAEGDPLPRVVPPGPDNPLGRHALRLSAAGYLIHGTNKPYGIGMRVTHGCIRMYPKDVETVFDSVRVGTAVHVVNQPYKVGLAWGRIFLEAHPHLDEDAALFSDQYSTVVRLILERVKAYDVKLEWEQVRAALKARDGVPREVGTFRPRTASADIASGRARPGGDG